ncbi:hypothetical protein L1049_023364 [Liquidambar formosana]|uniref:Uncharacterized protein n=1 Tax=Liquidambar formosana TaxID=63359 RepID=A0AAP0RZW7_LIQFO
MHVGVVPGGNCMQHCKLKINKVPFELISTKQRDGYRGILKRKQWQLQRETLWDDVATGIWGCNIWGNDASQTQRETHLQPPCQRKGP